MTPNFFRYPTASGIATLLRALAPIVAHGRQPSAEGDTSLRLCGAWTAWCPGEPAPGLISRAPQIHLLDAARVPPGSVARCRSGPPRVQLLDAARVTLGSGARCPSAYPGFG